MVSIFFKFHSIISSSSLFFYVKQTPKFPYQLSLNNPNQNKKKKNSIEVKIVNDEIIVRVTRDDMPFFIDERTARKKIYHAPQF